MPTFDELKSELYGAHTDAKTRQVLGDAVGQLQMALEVLSAHGHYYDLAISEGKQFLEFPKMVFSPTGEQLIVNSEEEEASQMATWKQVAINFEEPHNATA